jgi:hypothetical protein
MLILQEAGKDAAEKRRFDCPDLGTSVGQSSAGRGGDERLYRQIRMTAEWRHAYACNEQAAHLAGHDEKSGNRTRLALPIVASKLSFQHLSGRAAREGIYEID